MKCFFWNHKSGIMFLAILMFAMSLVAQTPPDLLPVINLTANVVAGNVVLTWQSPYMMAVVFPHKIYRDDTLLADNFMGYVYTDQAVPIGTHTYSVILKALGGGDGESAPTTIIITVGDQVYRPPVEDLDYSLLDNNVVLTWSTPMYPLIGTSPTYHYKIYRDSVLLINNIAYDVYTYTDHTVPAGTYTYTVIVVYTSGGDITTPGESDPITVEVTIQNTGFTITPSSISFGNIPVGEQTSQSIVFTNTGTNNLMVDNGIENEDDFIVPIFWAPWLVIPGESIDLQVFFRPQTPGFKTANVLIYYGDGDTWEFETVPVTGYGTTEGYIAPVINLEYTIEGGDVTLTWQSQYLTADVKHYKVYRDETLLFDGERGEAYTDTSVPAGTYLYSVRQCSHGGEIMSEPTTIEVTVPPTGTLQPVSNLRYSVAFIHNGPFLVRMDIILNWAAPSSEGLLGYNVYRDVLLTDSPINVTTFTDDTLNMLYTNYIHHIYSVTSVYSSGESTPVTVEAEIYFNQNSDVVTNLTYNVTDGNVVLAWNPPSALLSPELLVGYRVLRDGDVLAFPNVSSGTYADMGVSAGTHIYSVQACFLSEISMPTTVTVTVPLSDDDITNVVPLTALSSNYPNPFNPTTTIAFNMANEGHVVLEVYNTKGQRVKTLVDGVRGVGNHNVVWNGQDDSGRAVSSGIYFYRMTTGDFVSVKKMVMVK